jgi:DNA polymerase-3 subunit gamma/tau
MSSYKVIARKWRPQRFDDVVGQQAVTRTLRNAISSGRLAHAFVFAGPRGVGKTTTARILARALNCQRQDGPTPDPCGVCDACTEIAEGRDIDVLEIDAATNTQVDKVREVIIEGLSIMPVRDRRKVFIIDEVHQLSSSSFNALLKSIEEPPPHVVFMMATTELEKIPETILSRSQVYELRMIGTKQIADQLRRIVDAEKIEVSDEALQLIARDADGSMRDAQSKLDQVIAFTGATITADDVGTVLGLVGRDLLLGTLQAVAGEDAVSAFTLAGRAVEMGYDLRLVCRELSRMVRDLLVLSVDPSRVSDPEIAGESERERLLALSKRFSREDLLRSFDLLTRTEADIRAAAQPRYHLEMALLRWIHLRKLVPIEDLIQSAAGGTSGGRPASVASPARSASAAGAPGAAATRSAGAGATTTGAATTGARPAASTPAPSVTRAVPPAPAKGPVPSAQSAARTEPAAASGTEPRGSLDGAALRDAVLAEAKRSSPVLYNTVIAQAQRLEIVGDRLRLTYAASQKPGPAFEKYRSALEGVASKLAGRKISVEADMSGADAPDAASGGKAAADQERKTALKEQAMADAGVQALLEVFPAEIRDVEEM